jgi:hypothetical protein
MNEAQPDRIASAMAAPLITPFDFAMMPLSHDGKRGALFVAHDHASRCDHDARIADAHTTDDRPAGIERCSAKAGLVSIRSGNPRQKRTFIRNCQYLPFAGERSAREIRDLHIDTICS